MDLAIFCDSLSAMGSPCGPFQPENFRAQPLLATLWLPATPHPYISACGVDKHLTWQEIQLAINCGEGSLTDLE